MSSFPRRILITGGAGFLRSHLVDQFVSIGHNVTAFDNISSGRLNNLSRWSNHPRFKLLKGDMLVGHGLDSAVHKSELVIHLAARAEVRTGPSYSRVGYMQDVNSTYNLLEAMVKSGTCTGLIFASTSAVYGEPTEIPTPEDYGPLIPISLYGASKLACESIVSGYSRLFGFQAIILRLATIVGPRSTHGVIHDFLTKLRSDSKALEVLGDGRQSKSYLHVNDCASAFLLASQRLSRSVEIYNVGSEDEFDALSIAKMVAREARLPYIEPRCSGGVDGGRGWLGDVKRMLLDTSKIRRLGWRATQSSAEAVRMAIREMLRDQELTLEISAT